MRPYSEIHLSKSDIRILTALLKSKPKQISKKDAGDALIANELLLPNKRNISSGLVDDGTYRINPLAKGYLAYRKDSRRDVRITRTLSIVAIIISAIALLSELGILQLQ